MIKLEQDKYPLTSEALSKVDYNILFARAVTEGHIQGTIYADNIESPATFYIVHPYGMSLLLGSPGNNRFNLWFRDYALNKDGLRIKRPEWVQIYPLGWDQVFIDLFRDRLIKSSEAKPSKRKVIELNTRVNFKFNREKYLEYNKPFEDPGFQIVRTDKEYFCKTNGAVVPKNFWEDAEQFYHKGIGFSLIYNNALAATAFSAFILDNKLELGIETMPDYRRMGFAQKACSALIDYCLQNQFEPIWSCRLENIGSFNLAIGLGFEPTKYLPYYRLSDEEPQ